MLAVVSLQLGQLQLCSSIQQQTTAWSYPLLLCGWLQAAPAHMYQSGHYGQAPRPHVPTQAVRQTQTIKNQVNLM